MEGIAAGLHHSSKQRQILNPLSEARDWTCILTDTSQVLFLGGVCGIFVFLGLHLQHMEVSRLGVKWSYNGCPTPQPQECGIQATSTTTAHGNDRSLTHWIRPGIEPLSSWKLVRFISAEPQQELLKYSWQWTFKYDVKLHPVFFPVLFLKIKVMEEMCSSILA